MSFESYVIQDVLSGKYVVKTTYYDIKGYLVDNPLLAKSFKDVKTACSMIKRMNTELVNMHRCEEFQFLLHKITTESVESLPLLTPIHKVSEGYVIRRTNTASWIKTDFDRYDYVLESGYKAYGVCL